MLNTITRAGKVISLFTPATPEWGVREAATRLGVPRSNAHDILSSLASVGLLQRTDRGRYRLGWRLLTMSRNLIYGAGFQTDALAVLREVVEELGETATIGVWDGVSAVRLAAVTGVRPGAPTAQGMGTRAAGHATALGKALMATGSDADVRALVTRWGLPRLTARTVDAPDVLLGEVERIRATGVAESREESTPGVCCLAVLVRDSAADPVAALSVSVPVQRADLARQRYVPALSDAAQRLGRRLGDSLYARTPA